MKFHLTITNNETGETIRDENINAILAGIHNEKGTASIVITECTAVDLLPTIIAAKSAVKTCTDDDPMLALFVALTEGKLCKKAETEADTNDEKEGE